MNWRELQDFMNYADNDPLWARCPACGERVHQGVGTFHIKEEHPDIYNSIQQAVQRGKGEDK